MSRSWVLRTQKYRSPLQRSVNCQRLSGFRAWNRSEYSFTFFVYCQKLCAIFSSLFQFHSFSNLCNCKVACVITVKTIYQMWFDALCLCIFKLRSVGLQENCMFWSALGSHCSRALNMGISKVHWVKVVGVKVRGTVVLVMVVVTELLLLATSAIRTRITGRGSEVARLTYHTGLEYHLQLRNHLRGFAVF